MNLPLPSLNFGLLAVALLISACDEPISAEEKRRRAESAMGINASIAASSIVSAYRACSIVGVYKLDECAQIKSPLLADESAKLMAKMALDFSRDYWKECQAVLPHEYCQQLITRAVAIEQRKPRESNSNAFD